MANYLIYFCFSRKHSFWFCSKPDSDIITDDDEQERWLAILQKYLLQRALPFTTLTKL